jgi:hypothetical protein
MSGNISDLIQAGVLDGSELIEVTKNVAGQQHSRQTTTSDIANLANNKFKIYSFNPSTSTLPSDISPDDVLKIEGSNGTVLGVPVVVGNFLRYYLDPDTSAPSVRLEGIGQKIYPFNPVTSGAIADSVFIGDNPSSVPSVSGNVITVGVNGTPDNLSSSFPYQYVSVSTDIVAGSSGTASLQPSQVVAGIYFFLVVHKNTSTAQQCVAALFGGSPLADSTLTIFCSIQGGVLTAHLINSQHIISAPLTVTTPAIAFLNGAMQVDGVTYSLNGADGNRLSTLFLSLGGTVSGNSFNSNLQSASSAPTPLPLDIKTDDILQITGPGTVLGVSVALNSPPDWLRYYIDPVTGNPRVRLEHDTTLDLSTLSNTLNVVGSKTVEVSDVPSLSPIVLTTKPTGIFTFVSSKDYVPASGGQPDSITVRLAPNFRSGKIVLTNHNPVSAGLAVIANQPKATMLGSFNAIAENTLVQQSVFLGAPLNANTNVEPFVSAAYDITATSDAVLIKETMKACSEPVPVINVSSFVGANVSSNTFFNYNWSGRLDVDLRLDPSTKQGYTAQISAVSCVSTTDSSQCNLPASTVTLDRTQGLSARLIQNLISANSIPTDANGQPTAFVVGSTYNMTCNVTLTVPQPIGSVDYNGGAGVVSTSHPLNLQFVFGATPTNAVTFAGIGLLPAATTAANWSCTLVNGIHPLPANSYDGSSTTTSTVSGTPVPLSGFISLLQTLPDLIVTYNETSGDLTVANASRYHGLDITLTTDGDGVFTPSNNPTFVGSATTSSTGVLLNKAQSPLNVVWSGDGTLLANTDTTQPQIALWQTLGIPILGVGENLFLDLNDIPSNIVLARPVFSNDGKMVVYAGVSQDALSNGTHLYVSSCDLTTNPPTQATPIPVVNNFSIKNFKQVALSLDKNTIFAVGGDNALYQFDLVSGSYTSVGTTAINLGLQANDVLKELAMSPDGTKLALVTSNTSGFDSVYVFSWNGTTLTIVPSFPVVSTAGSAGSALYESVSISISELIWTDDSQNVLMVQYGSSILVYEIGIIPIATPAITNIYSDYGSGGTSHALSGLSISGSRLFFLSTAYNHNPFISYIDLNLTALSVIRPIAPSYEPAYVALNSLSINKADSKTLVITDTSPRGYSFYAVNNDNSISFLS